jgi:peroxiredoxin
MTTSLDRVVAVGARAPDFELRDQHGQPVRLSDFRGRRNVVLVFFPLAFTPTCTGELCAIRDESALDTGDVQVVAVSCDSSAALRVFAEQEGLDYPLLSDFWPHGAVSSAYGVFLERRGFAARGTFLIDKDGIVRWSVVNWAGDARSTQDYRRAIAEL